MPSILIFFLHIWKYVKIFNSQTFGEGFIRRCLFFHRIKYALNDTAFQGGLYRAGWGG